MSQPLVHLSKAKVKVDGKEALVLMMSQEKREEKRKSTAFCNINTHFEEKCFEIIFENEKSINNIYTIDKRSRKKLISILLQELVW